MKDSAGKIPHPPIKWRHPCVLAHRVPSELSPRVFAKESRHVRSVFPARPARHIGCVRICWRIQSRFHGPDCRRHGRHNPQGAQDGRDQCRNPPVPLRSVERRTHRSEETRCRNQMAGARTGSGRHARRAARNDAEARAVLGDGARLAEMRGQDQRGAELRHRNRRSRHSFHPRPLQARTCAADHHHAWLARLDHRADEGHRSADRSHGAWRNRSGRVPRRDPVAAGLRLLGQTHEAGMESRQHRESVGDPHAAPRLHQIRGAGRRLGQCHFRGDGLAATAGIARHPYQHGGDGSAGCFEGAFRGRSAARRTIAGGKACVGSARRLL